MMPDDGLAAPPSPPHSGGPLAAIVLNYKTPGPTLQAVSSLHDSTRPPDILIVVDNAAEGDNRLRMALAADVVYLPTPRNFGFSGGVNVGIRHALAGGAERVLLVNSDAAVDRECLARLEDAFVADRAVGIAGPTIRSRGDRQTILSLGLRYSPRSGRMRDRAADRVVAPAGATQRVDAVTGCVMLVRREVFTAIGLFDEDYFFSFEDLDFCLKAARAGFASAIVTGASAAHDGSRTIGPESRRRLYFAARNHLLVGSRMAPTPNRWLGATRFASIVTLNALHAVRASGGTLTERLGAVWSGTSDYLAGRFGDAPVSVGTQGAGG
jgi:GT2 family glycosyltransferase